MAENYLLEAALENSEAFSDLLIKNEIIKAIPVVSTAINAYKGARDIRDRIFAAKILVFFSALDKTSSETKEKIRQKMVGNVNEAKKVGRIVLLNIEKATDLEKSYIIGVLFLAYIYDHLDINNFYRLCDVVDLSFIEDLKKILSEQELTDESTMQYLARSGITQPSGGKTWKEVGDIFYELSPLGNLLKETYNYGLEKIVEKDGSCNSGMT